jgi:hypothetical protein
MANRKFTVNFAPDFCPEISSSFQSADFGVKFLQTVRKLDFWPETGSLGAVFSDQRAFDRPESPKIPQKFWNAHSAARVFTRSV